MQAILAKLLKDRMQIFLVISALLVVLATAGIAFLDVGLALGFLSVVSAAVLTIRRPALGIAFLVGSMPVAKFLMVVVPSFNRYHINFDTLFLGLTVLVVLLQRRLRLEDRLSKRMLVAWSALLGIHIIWIAVQYLTFRDVDAVREAIYLLVKFAEYGSLFLLVPMTIRQDTDLRFVMGSYVVGFAPLGVYGVLQYMAQHQVNVNLLSGMIITNGGLSNLRAFSTMVNLGPNFYGFYLSTVLVVMIACLSFDISRAWRTVLVSLGVLGLVNLYLTESRGALLAAVVGVFAMFAMWLMERNRGISLRTGVILLLPVPFLTLQRYLDPASKFGRSADTASGTSSVTPTVPAAHPGTTSAPVDFSVSERLVLLRAALDQFAHHPLLGMGFNGFSLTTMELVHYSTVVHNQYVSTLVEFGLIGFLLFATAGGLLVYPLLRSALNLLRAGGTTAVQRGVVAAFLGATAAFLVANLTANALYFPEVLGPMAVLAGMATYVVTRSARTTPNHM